MVKIQGGKKLEAVTASNVENNSIFLDDNDNKIKIKDNSGNTGEISMGGDLLTNDCLITKIDQLIDRDVTRSNDKASPFVEAYTSAAGRKGSVDIGETTGFFDNEKYFPSSSAGFMDGTLDNPNSFSDTDNGFDGNDSTSATKSQGSVRQFSWYLGKIFAEKEVTIVKINATLFWGGNDSGDCGLILQTYDGSDWVNAITLTNVNVSSTTSTTFNSAVALNQAVQGIRIRFRNNSSIGRTNTATLRNLEIGASETSEIFHTTPPETFKDNVSSGVAAVKIVDWEDGANLQWKATNEIAEKEFRQGTIQDPDSFNNVNNFFNYNPSNGATKTTASETTYSLGKTFNPVFVDSVKVSFSHNSSSMTTRLQKYDGSAWSDVGSTLLGSAGTYSGTVSVNDTVQGLRLSTTTTTTWSRTATYRYIETNSATVEDTGWQDFNISGDTAYAKLSSFTAFTSEPTSFVVKLIPKTTSPTAGCPSIAGVAIKLI